jgi:hypothetical protein
MHRNTTEENGLDLSASGYGQVPSYCEYANGPSDSKQSQERLAYQKDSTPGSQYPKSSSSINC